ncbi:hypothetical protein VSS16_30235 [Streptomyces broussonetiae]|uniref:DoxX family membrane protein n=2 Tax=Streptomyces broussonetiae TaxID=2686304 RepID=A0ABV5EJD6_9ACTN
MRIYARTVRALEQLSASLGITLLRISIGLIYVWFGAPKFVPGLSPAESLAADTTERLTFGLLSGGTASVLTGALETAIGLLLISGHALAPTLLLQLAHMAGTFTPLLLFPDRTWETYGICTLEGQYILKNLVLVAASLVIIGHSRNRPQPPPPPEDPPPCARDSAYDAGDWPWTAREQPAHAHARGPDTPPDDRNTP